MSEDKVSKAIATNLKQQIAEQTSNIYDSLVGVKVNSQLPEDIFRGYFLPHFSGHQPISKNSQVFAEWISIAGTPTSEVDIIDQHGQVLFTVPSLFDTRVIDTVKRDVGNSIADIYSQFDLKSTNIPSVANNYLNRELSKKLSILDTDVKHDDVTKRWIDIFHRYGLEVEDTVNDPKSSTVDPGEDLIYD